MTCADGSQAASATFRSRSGSRLASVVFFSLPSKSTYRLIANNRNGSDNAFFSSETQATDSTASG